MSRRPSGWLEKFWLAVDPIDLPVQSLVIGESLRNVSGKCESPSDSRLLRQNLFMPADTVQPRHPRKFAKIARHRRGLVAQRSGRNQGVMRPDGRARSLQRHPDSCGMRRTRCIERQHLYGS